MVGAKPAVGARCHTPRPTRAASASAWSAQPAGNAVVANDRSGCRGGGDRGVNRAGQVDGEHLVRLDCGVADDVDGDRLFRDARIECQRIARCRVIAARRGGAVIGCDTLDSTAACA